LDFSSKSLAEARKLAGQTASSGGDKLEFVEASVYDACGVLEPGGYDLVFTGIGALCWIPSIAEWAKVISGLLKPGGRLFMREGHPVLWALDQTAQHDVKLELPYFEQPEPVLADKPGHVRGNWRASIRRDNWGGVQPWDGGDCDCVAGERVEDWGVDGA